MGDGAIPVPTEGDENMLQGRDFLARKGRIYMHIGAVRGAITVESNTSEEILFSTKQLLELIIEKNNLHKDDIVSIIFTMTDDLNAAFPAVAARNMGFTNAALMCMRELEISGSLRKCIRVLLHINTEKAQNELFHIYEKGAKVLRPDLV